MAVNDARPNPNKTRDTVLGVVFAVLGLAFLFSAPSNSSLEGWGMLLRALAGQALVIAGIDRLSRVVLGRPSPTAWLAALLGSSVALFPLAGIALLMSKEGGSSWGIAALILMAWYLVAGVFAAVKLLVSRRRPKA